MHYIGIKFAVFKGVKQNRLHWGVMYMNQKVELLDEDLIFLNYEAKDRQELLENLFKELQKRGYVKNSYLQGILNREKIFPTGLNTDGVKVAVPHTDAIHVNKPVIVVAKLKDPVIFKEMGNSANDVRVQLVFMLAIKNPDIQVKTLSNLMSIFSDKEKLIDVYESVNKKQIMYKLSKILVNK
jgi:galactitol PTS system EIIA component